MDNAPLGTQNHLREKTNFMSGIKAIEISAAIAARFSFRFP
jgi:hypothetical protein